MINASDNGRRFLRAPLELEVHYRTAGSFLVSYSLNLSKGGIFIETTALLPIGTDITVRFSVPQLSDPIETEATVVWTRPAGNSDGLPAGLGLQFNCLEDRLGSVIDRLVQGFSGMRVVTVAAKRQDSDRMNRYLRSIMHCDVLACADVASFSQALDGRVDLLLVDLDSAGPASHPVIEKAMRSAPPIPVLAFTRDAEHHAHAQALGAQVIAKNPPPFDQLRQQLLDALGKPWRAQSGNGRQSLSRDED